MRKIFFLLFIIMAGCKPTDSQSDINQYFDLDSFVHQLIVNQTTVGNYHVIKTSVANGVEEHTEIEKTDSLFWVTELTPLIKADINKPSLVDAYKISDGLKEQNSNLQKLVYSEKPETNADVIRLEIKYLDNTNDVRQVVAWTGTQNPVYSAKQKIDLWVNRYKNTLLIDSLSVKGYNKTLLQDSLLYQSKTIVKHE